MTTIVRFLTATAFICILIATAVRGVHEVSAGPVGQNCDEVLTNGGFESGTTGWSTWSALGYNLVSDFNPRTGVLGAYLGGDNNSHDLLSQTIALPPGMVSLGLSFWWSMTTEESAGSFDHMTVSLEQIDGSPVAVLLAVDNTAAVNVWDLATADLAKYAGQNLKLSVVVTTDASHPASFFVDDVSVLACAEEVTPTPTPTVEQATATPTLSPKASATPTGTSSPTVTPSVTPVESTASPTPTSTSTEEPLATATPTPTRTATATVTPTTRGPTVTAEPEAELWTSYLPCVLQ